MKLLIFGLGYSAARFATLHRTSFASITGTVRSSEKAALLGAAGYDVIIWPGGDTKALTNAIANATHILISTPPGEEGDPVLAALGADLAKHRNLRWIGYWSTIAVYGDAGGKWVDEATPCNPANARGQARLAAEQGWARIAEATGAALHLMRLPGIYGPGRSAIDSLRDGSAKRLIKPGQVFNRIHVDDIAGATLAAAKAWQRLPGRHVFNITDDEPAPPQDVVTYAAGLLGTTPPPEQDFATATLSPMARSFYGENKRVSNALTKAALGWQPRFASYREGLTSILAAGDQAA
ncbi:MAG: SDR family oxidoreductase [Bosea sp. (in: a-proteobacteria)]